MLRFIIFNFYLPLYCSAGKHIGFETLHTVILIYAPKSIHFGDDTYNMRVQLAVLDWVSINFE